MMGAEESGGFGFGMHLPERDGVYADLMLLDLFMRERAAGRWPVSRAIEHFHEIAGPSWYRRIDVHVERAAYPEVKRRLLVDLREQAPTELAGQPVVRTLPLETNDGFKFWLADGSWLLVRASGTEPLVRIYTEATSEAIQEALLDRRRATGPRPMSASEPREAGKVVDKPWGQELIWAHTDRYVGKVIVIDAGKRLSLQRHVVKDEIDPASSSGRLRLTLEDETGEIRVEELGPGEHRHVPTGRIHRYEAIERTELVEVSTPELDDVVRLEDDFGREGTSAP